MPMLKSEDRKGADYKLGWSGIVVPIIPEDVLVVSSYRTYFDDKGELQSDPIALIGNTDNVADGD